ncbi:hypothetical protein A943_04615 [Bacillus sp. CPSM8]|nr:hypothetical protein A943_04615 [Bacillus sp. CPSM8]KUL18739.1 hypothetical protein LI6934_04405 [Bacillus licheniformis LMG 6934]
MIFRSASMFSQAVCLFSYQFKRLGKRNVLFE